jgi:uncharacterized protein (DUF433 family)
VDSERAFGKQVITGTRVTAVQVLASSAVGRTEAQIRAEHRVTTEQIRAVLRYAVALADQNLDATFAALWADPERNAASRSSAAGLRANALNVYIDVVTTAA